MTPSSSVHSLTTVQTGSACSRCIAEMKRVLSLGSPSVAITTTTFWPCARSFSALGAIMSQILWTDASSGVVPVGDVAITRFSSSSVALFPAGGGALFPAASDGPRLTNCEAAGGGFRRWKSVRTPSAVVSSPMPVTTSPSSAQRVVATFLYEVVPGFCTKRQPSDDAIEPLLSTIQMRSGNASREPRSAFTRPIG